VTAAVALAPLLRSPQILVLGAETYVRLAFLSDEDLSPDFESLLSIPLADKTGSLIQVFSGVVTRVDPSNDDYLVQSGPLATVGCRFKGNIQGFVAVGASLTPVPGSDG
jgi:hypothetical protein